MDENIRHIYDDAISMYKEANYSLAIKLFSEVIAIDENSYNAFYGRGLCYCRTYQYALAESDFQKALELKPYFLDALYNMGNIYLEQERFREASKVYENIISMDKKHIKSYNNLGYVLYKLEDYPHSIEVYSRGLEHLNTTEDDIATQRIKANMYNNRGNAYDDSGNFEHAISDYSRAIEIDAHNIEYYFNRAVLYYRIEEYSKTIADLSQALNLIEKEYSYEDIESENDVILDTYYYRGISYFYERSYIQALDDLLILLKYDTKNIEALMFVARCYKQLQDYENAVNYYDRVLAIDNNESVAYFELAFVYSETKDYKMALRYIDKAIQINGQLSEAYHYREFIINKLDKN